MAGYSGTPLWKKLGLKAGHHVTLIHPPSHFQELLLPLSNEVIFSEQANSQSDILHLFTKSKQELSQVVQQFLNLMHPNAVIWISWPKKSSKVPTDISEDVIREIILPLGLVDIKVCAIDEIWSALKIVLRKELRKS